MNIAEFMFQVAGSVNRAACNLVDNDVQVLISAIRNNPGHLFLSGLGKSGHIAKLASSTFSSVGIPCFFLHPVEATHGDVGKVLSGDVVIFISNGGETEEVNSLCRFLKGRLVQSFGVTRSKASTLGRLVDHVIQIGVEKEACPYNLVPSSSTTVQKAFLDALALTVADLNGFSAIEFSKNHPAGRLGRRLTLTVAALMCHEPGCPRIGPLASLHEVVNEIARVNLGGVAVVGDGGSLKGIITDGDIRRLVGSADPPSWGRLIAKDIMVRSPVFTYPDSLAMEALEMMESRSSQITVLPVVEKNTMKLVGWLRLHDIVRAGIL